MPICSDSTYATSDNPSSHLAVPHRIISVRAERRQKVRHRVKVYISTDFEGVAGIVDWDQIMVGSHDYALGRRLLLGEVNAAIDGAAEAGAEIFSSMTLTAPCESGADLLHGRASLLSGKHKPMYMMEGLDDTFDASSSSATTARSAPARRSRS